MAKRLLLVLLGALGLGQTTPDPAREIASAIEAKQYEQAIGLARTALEQTPGNVRILIMEGIALSALGRDPEALSAYDRALELSPGHLAALKGAVQIEYKAGTDRAIPLLDRILKLRPDDSTAHAMRAVMAWKKSDCDTAVLHFRLAEGALPSQPEALREYAVCLVRLKRPAEGVRVFKQLLALNPSDGRSRRRLAAAQLMAKEYAGAIATLGPAVEGKDADPESLELAASVWEAMGDTPRAVAALRHAIVLSPSTVRFYVDFVELCLVHKSYQVGIDMIRTGLAHSPKASVLYVARGVLHVQLGDYDQADADFAAAERLDPLHSRGALARGLSQIQRADWDSALATVREQLKTQPGNDFLYYLLAEILSSTGAEVGSPRFKEAISAASRAVEIKPDFYLARDILSRLYLQAGEIDLAIEQCHLALRDKPTDDTALYRLIRALKTRGRPEDTAQIPALLKRFNEVRLELRRQESEEARYKLVEEEPR